MTVTTFVPLDKIAYILKTYAQFYMLM